MTGGRLLVVGRLRRPHGLKGEVAVFPLSDRPADALAAGRRLARLDLAGARLGEPVVVEWSRPYHREWLLKFVGVEERAAVESWRGGFLAAPEAELAAPDTGEVYHHELVGFAVADPAGTPLGIVSALYELPAGLTIEVQGAKREFLLPYRREFVVAVDRAGRRLTVTVPDGLLEVS